MSDSQLHQILDRTAYLWESGTEIPLGFVGIEGRKSGQEICIYGTTLPSFQYVIHENGKIVVENRHFSTAKDALCHALNWSEQTDSLPALRRTEWYKGHYAWAVDGFEDADIVVIESEVGRFSLRTDQESCPTRYEHDPRWKTPLDALTL